LVNPGEDCEEQIFFVPKVGIDRTLGESGHRRHLVQSRSVEATLGEDLGGGPEKVLAG
jgi:hypothetical protein